jgi:hypothetical protein
MLGSCTGAWCGAFDVGVGVQIRLHMLGSYTGAWCGAFDEWVCVGVRTGQHMPGRL